MPREPYIPSACCGYRVSADFLHLKLRQVTLRKVYHIFVGMESKFELTVSRILDNWQHGFHKGLGV